MHLFCEFEELCNRGLELEANNLACPPNGDGAFGSLCPIRGHREQLLTSKIP